MHSSSKKRDTHLVREWGSKMRKLEARATRRQADKEEAKERLDETDPDDWRPCDCGACP